VLRLPGRLLLLAPVAWLAAAADFGALKPRGYVNDFAGVLSPPAVRRLDDYLKRVEEATGAQIAIVTLRSLEGEPVEDVATLLYKNWGIGQKGKDEGALFLLSIQDRKSRLEVGYGLEPYIPDGVAGSILRQMRPALQANQFDAALATATAELGERVARAKGVEIAESVRPRQTPQRRGREPSLGGLIALAIFLAILAAIGSAGGRGGGAHRRNVPGNSGRDVLTGMILGSLLGQSIGRGGGGFGGYDAGGGFGGFGGGLSGGGGASMDW
jgi:uncharacterized protein